MIQTNETCSYEGNPTSKVYCHYVGDPTPENREVLNQLME